MALKKDGANAPLPLIYRRLKKYAGIRFGRFILSGKSNVIHGKGHPVPVALNGESLFPLYEKCLKNDIRRRRETCGSEHRVWLADIFNQKTR